MPIIVVAIVVVAAIGGIYLMNELGEPDLDTNEISATLIIDYGNGTIETYNVTTANNSVPGLLDEAIGADNYTLMRDVGGNEFIYSVKGVKWEKPPNSIEIPPDKWVYYVNGTKGPNLSESYKYAAKVKMIEDGQIVKVALETSDEWSAIFHDTGVSVEVIIDYGNGTVVSHNVTTQNFTALGCLEAAVGYENLDIQTFSFGVLVNGINNVTTGSTVEGIDDTSNYYWMWYINDGWASVGAGQYVCQNGDVVKFAFEESSW